MSDTTVPEEWCRQLATAIAATLREYQAQKLHHTSITMFHVGCYPWDALIELSLLTAEEFAADPLLNAPKEVAAWQQYDFAADLETWQAAIPLKRQMADAYSAASEAKRPLIAGAYVRACAEAAATPEVADALATLNQSGDFRISVTHPDTHHEFYLPEEMDAG